MNQKERLEFMYNQGLVYGANGYYKHVNDGFKAFASFGPYSGLGIGEGADFTAFKVGFKKSQQARIKVMNIKTKAEAFLKPLMSKLPEALPSKTVSFVNLEDEIVTMPREQYEREVQGKG